MTNSELVSIFVLNVAWPVLMAYAGYRIVLAVGCARIRGRGVDVIIAGVGGVIAWWGRVLYSYDLPLDWPFALTVLGVALMVSPKLSGLARGQRT